MSHVVDRLSLTGAPTAAIPHPQHQHHDTTTPTTTTIRTPNNTTIERTGTTASTRSSTSTSSTAASAKSATAPPSSHGAAAAPAGAAAPLHSHLSPDHDDNHQPLIRDLLALYSFRLAPAEAAAVVQARYAPEAVLRDPVSVARGREGIERLFVGMAGGLFADARTEDYHVLATGSTPQELHLDLTQKYVFKSSIPLKEKGTSKTVTAKIALKLDPLDGMILEHMEQWDHEQPSDDGFVGKVQKFRKKMGAELVENTMTSGA